MTAPKPNTELEEAELNSNSEAELPQDSDMSNSDTSNNAETDKLTTLEMLRHGELEGGDIFRGSTDDALTDNGWRQMVNGLGDENDWDIIITSPLSSCREFAELIAKEEEIDLEINNKYQEIDFGDWEDQTPKELLKENADLLVAWWNAPTKITPPQGEDFHEFKARVLKAYKLMLQDYKGKRILLVTHAGVIRIILMHVLGMQEDALFSLNVDYASYSKVSIEHSDDNIGASERGMLIEHR